MVWNVGDLCVARSARHRESYNCQILKLPPNCAQDKALLNFIEYGETEEIPIAELNPFGEFAVNKKGELVRDSSDITAEHFGGWKVGDRCVAWWSQDDTWNQATILKVFSPVEVLVRFTDYGNADFSALADLKKDGGEVEPSGDSVTFEDLKPQQPSGGNSGQEMELMEHCKGNNRLWKEGDVCVAQWKEDGIWYNSKIVEINQQDVLVEFIDYGNQDYTTIEELKPAGTLEDIKNKDEIIIESKPWKIGDLCVTKSSKFDGIFNSQILKVYEKTALVSHIEFTKEEEVSLSELNSFGDFAVNRNGDLMTGMKGRSEGIWTDGDLCVALWDVDNNWYNANILKIFGLDEVLVLFIDHGNADFARIADLKPAGSPLGTDTQRKCDGDDKDIVVEVDDLKEHQSANSDNKTSPMNINSPRQPLSGHSGAKQWIVGDFCVAMWNEDGVWYSSKILDINGEKVLVQFVDYGNEDFTIIDQLKPAGSLEIDVEQKEKDYSKWKVGDECVAMWNEDGEWYNSKILEINGEKVFVQFIDYGNEDYTTISQLKPAGSLETNCEPSLNKPTNKETIEKSEPEKLNVAIQKEKLSSKWKVGNECVAMWNEDGEWYNSKILEIIGEKVLVQFVEYGNEDFTTICQLKTAGSLDTDVEQKPKSIETDMLAKAEPEQVIGDMIRKDNVIKPAGMLNEDKCKSLHQNIKDQKINSETLVMKMSTTLPLAKPKTVVAKKVSTNSAVKSHMPTLPLENSESQVATKISTKQSYVPESVVARKVTVKQDVKVPTEKIQERSKSIKDVGKWMPGDKVVAYWEKDNKWRRAIIQEVEKDQVFVFCPNENMVRATWVNVASLKPKSSSLDLLNEQSKPKPLATSEKIVQAWIEKHHSGSSKDNSPDAVQVEHFDIVKNSKPYSQAFDTIANKMDSQLKKKEKSSAPIPDARNRIGGSELEKNTINGLGAEVENRPMIGEKSELENKIMSAERPNLVNKIMSGKGSPILVNGEESNIVTRIEKILNGPITSLEGRVFAQAFTSSGSRYLQSEIPGMKQEEICLMQDELMTDELSAMNHSTATFVVQKLIEVADSTSMEMFVSNVEKNFTSLSLNPAGCRVVQKCLHVANPPQQTRIILQLENYKTIISLLRSKHGTYVAQACLPMMPVRTITFIVNSLLGHMVDIGRNQHGTYFLQQMLGGVAAKKISMDLLVEEIVNNVGLLAHDKFGTYLLQCVLPSSALAASHVSTWVLTNMSAVYRSSPSMFLTLALIKRLVIANKSALLMDVIASCLVFNGDGQPLFVAMSLHQVGHLLAKEILSQIPIMSDMIKSKLLATLTKYADVLKTDPYGCIVLKALHGRL